MLDVREVISNKHIAYEISDTQMSHSADNMCVVTASTQAQARRTLGRFRSDMQGKANAGIVTPRERRVRLG